MSAWEKIHLLKLPPYKLTMYVSGAKDEPLHHNEPWLPDFSCYSLPKRGKNIPKWPQNYQIVTKYTKWPKNFPNGHKIYQNIPLKGSTKHCKVGIFGMKICFE
jgi:hypothetical protein